MRAKIIKRTIEAARPRRTLYFIRDTELEGFVAVITPTGAKWYAVEFWRQWRKRRLPLGKHGDWTPEKARARAKQVLAKIATGHDPLASQREIYKPLTFSELADLYIAKHTYDGKASMLQSDGNLIEDHIRPLLGPIIVDDITPAAVEQMRDLVAAGRTVKGAKDSIDRLDIDREQVAAQCVALVSTILSYSQLLKEKKGRGRQP